MNRVVLFALLLASAPLATGAGAQTRHNTNAPIDFGADTIELQDRANRAVLSGNVAVRQAEMALNASRMTVSYTGGRRQSAGVAT
jgi:lipopolysaccharide export system protein LptA